jgi:hypothetical protein
VGQSGSVRGSGGRVISILKDKDASKMDVLAKELGFEYTDLAPVKADIPPIPLDEDGEVDLENADVEKMRQYLEDTMSFIALADDGTAPDSAPAAQEAIDVDYSNDKDGNDDDDDGDELDVEIGFQ